MEFDANLRNKIDFRVQGVTPGRLTPKTKLWLRYRPQQQTEL